MIGLARPESRGAARFMMTLGHVRNQASGKSIAVIWSTARQQKAILHHTGGGGLEIEALAAGRQATRMSDRRDAGCGHSTADGPTNLVTTGTRRTALSTAEWPSRDRRAVIVGGGLTGAVIAQTFATHGIAVAVVEAGLVARGSTAASSAAAPPGARPWAAGALRTLWNESMVSVSGNEPSPRSRFRRDAQAASHFLRADETRRGVLRHESRRDRPLASGVRAPHSGRFRRRVARSGRPSSTDRYSGELTDVETACAFTPHAGRLQPEEG